MDSVSREAGDDPDVTVEAIIVDNDPPGSGVAPEGAEVVVSGRNVGFARAVNLGLRRASGEYIVLINPDSTLEGGFFGAVSEFFGVNPQVGVIGPRVLDADGAVQLSARREFSFISGLFGRTSLLTKLLPESRFVRDHFPTTDSEESSPVDWVSGACMVVRREVFEQIGLLDERFFMYFEDADLCRRAREAGFGVAYLPQASVVHDAGGSTRSRPQAILRLHRSAYLYHRKHRPEGSPAILDALVLAGLAARAAAGLVLAFAKPPENR